MRKSQHVLEKFKVFCNQCGGNDIEKEDSRGYSPESGSWGELVFLCVKCGIREIVAE